MCRLFGYFSPTASTPPALSGSKDAFVHLSEYHRDGWGLAYYEFNETGRQVHLQRALQPAYLDPNFAQLAQNLHTQTLIAHLRLATIGENKLQNNHPFSYGNWVFAHNGNIKSFDKYRDLILSQIDPHFRTAIRGETDSELIFYYLLSELERWGLVSEQYPSSCQEIGRSLKWALENLISLIGPFEKQKGPASETYLSFLLSNGRALWAHQGGQPLYYQVVSASEASPLAHILLCSEPLGQATDWLPVPSGVLLAVDQSVQVFALRGY